MSYESFATGAGAAAGAAGARAGGGGAREPRAAYPTPPSSFLKVEATEDGVAAGRPDTAMKPSSVVVSED